MYFQQTLHFHLQKSKHVYALLSLSSIITLLYKARREIAVTAVHKYRRIANKLIFSIEFYEQK